MPLIPPNSIRETNTWETLSDLHAVFNPDEYYTLMSFITTTGNLYLEYNAYNEIRSQFPVTVSQFPKCPDDLHDYPEKVKFSLESSYIGSPGYIGTSESSLSSKTMVMISPQVSHKYRKP